MDKEKFFSQQLDLVQQIEMCAEEAISTLGQQTRAEFRADPALQKALVDIVLELCQDVTACIKQGGYQLPLNSRLEEVGLPPANKLSAETLNPKKLYNFIHTQLPLFVESLQEPQEILEDHAYGPPDPLEMAEEEMLADLQNGRDQGSKFAGPQPGDVLLIDRGMPMEGFPAYGSIMPGNRKVARASAFSRLDRLLLEKDILEELAKKTGRPVDVAQKLVYQAIECEEEEEKLALIRRAMALDPNNVDAQILWAEETTVLIEDSLPLYLRALETATRQFKPTAFEAYKGTFWQNIATRPYMRARAAVAEDLYYFERQAEALGHWEAMLDLNPLDNQGVREELMIAYLDMGRLDQAERLHERFRQDPSGFWAWSRALIEFLKSGDTETARAALKTAVAVNPHTRDYLVEEKCLPLPRPEYYTLGSVEEAVHYIDEAEMPWRNSPEAMTWLSEHT